MKKKIGNPYARSVVLHLMLVAFLAFILVFEHKGKVEEPIVIENISFHEKVKRTFHKAIHTIGIPHEEPSLDDSNVKQESLMKPSSYPSAVSPEEGSGSPMVNPMQQYILEVVERVDQNKKYPKEAQFNEQEGVVEIEVQVFPDGNIGKMEIRKSSPFLILNQAAMQAVEKIGILPALPLQADGKVRSEPISLRIPIHFQLK